MGRLPAERIERKVFLRQKARTDDKFGCDPYERPIQEHLNFGIININKPSGPTSHQVSAYVKHILGLKKTGHSGTLDPKVTGVLPVATGRATRIVQTLLPTGKEYVCILHLHAPADNVEEVMQSYVGKIKQMPPIKSSVKRQWRYRKIYYINVLEVEEKDVLFKVGCQAGTYVRKLCSDIGDSIGTGGHMAELIRSKVGGFNTQNAYTLNELRDAYAFYEKENTESFLRYAVRPVEEAVHHLPRVWVRDSAIEPLCHGTNLAAPGISMVESDIQLQDMVAVMSLKGELVAIGYAQMISKHMTEKERGIAVNTDKVFMQPGTYPRVTDL